MKINPLYQSDIVSRYVSNASVVPRKTETAGSISSGDTVELSSGAQGYAQLLRDARSALEDSEGNEEARATTIKASIDAGEYQVSDDSLVNALTGHRSLPDYG